MSWPWCWASYGHHIIKSSSPFMGTFMIYFSQVTTLRLRDDVAWPWGPGERMKWAWTRVRLPLEQNSELLGDPVLSKCTWTHSPQSSPSHLTSSQGLLVPGGHESSCCFPSACMEPSGDTPEVWAPRRRRPQRSRILLWSLSSPPPVGISHMFLTQAGVSGSKSQEFILNTFSIKRKNNFE